MITSTSTNAIDAPPGFTPIYDSTGDQTENGTSKRKRQHLCRHEGPTKETETLVWDVIFNFNCKGRGALFCSTVLVSGGVAGDHDSFWSTF